MARDPLLSGSSAVMVAPTSPTLASYAVTTPPFWVPAPTIPLATLLLIGNLFGWEVSQVTWLVTSRMVGAVA